MTNEPSPGELLLMFESLAIEYEAFDDMLPESAQFEFGASRDPATFRSNQLRAMLLRKFITKKDAVYLPKVYDAMVSSAAPEFLENCKLNVATRKADFKRAGQSMTEFGVGHGDEQTIHGEHDIYYDLNYGRLLHADFDRWGRLERMPDLYLELAVWEVHSNYAWLVKEARIVVTEGRSTGRLNVPERSHAPQFPVD
ncbi:hypothetical protein [Pseudarthrobacter scleromae]|nr:hypothetical protein [Pseudarthrobacter scleromae]